MKCFLFLPPPTRGRTAEPVISSSFFFFLARPGWLEADRNKGASSFFFPSPSAGRKKASSPFSLSSGLTFPFTVMERTTLLYISSFPEGVKKKEEGGFFFTLGEDDPFIIFSSFLVPLLKYDRSVPISFFPFPSPIGRRGNHE